MAVDYIDFEGVIALYDNNISSKSLWICFFVFNATFSNISAISWRPVPLVEEAGVHGENYRPWASNW
jgi:hypothetical protein